MFHVHWLQDQSNTFFTRLSSVYTHTYLLSYSSSSTTNLTSPHHHLITKLWHNKYTPSPYTSSYIFDHISTKTILLSPLQHRINTTTILNWPIFIDLHPEFLVIQFLHPKSLVISGFIIPEGWFIIMQIIYWTKFPNDFNQENVLTGQILDWWAWYWVPVLITYAYNDITIN